ncbi:MAG: MarR family transcriptional regulator [Pseudomonadales bacterium]
MKDSPSYDDQTLWALRMFHEILADLWERSRTRNLTRILVLRAISLEGEEGIGVQEISERLGIPVATVSHAVSGLQNDGYLSPVEHESDVRHHSTRYSFQAREKTQSWAAEIARISVHTAVEVFGGVEPAIERFRALAVRIDRDA